ncbi:hypothetical protein [Streptomyces coelicoflavus]|uniref:hypothetical protein n=1 Tax=Streptomyces coelicoflavus TaxID=285562 RepID=UPI001EF3982E|nr:hypothetical protein [Streptomyces coelicoflavus]
MPLHAGEHRAAGPRRAGPRRRGPDRRRFRLYGLAGVVVCAVVLPFAVASAGPSGDGGEEAPVAVPLLARGGDGKAPASGAEPGTWPGAEPGAGSGTGTTGTASGSGVVGSGSESGAGSGSESGGADRGAPETGPARSPLPPGLALAARCGPELTSPAGVEAQTCVLARGAQTWARTYYRNVTGGPLESVLSLMGPDGRSVRTRCAVSAEDAPGTCETPPDTGSTARGGLAGYTAIAEFARRAGYGPLLLRAGSAGSAGSTGRGGDGGDGRAGGDGNAPAETPS